MTKCFRCLGERRLQK